MSTLRYSAVAAMMVIVLVASCGGGVMAANEPAPPACSTVYDNLQSCVSYLSGRGDPAKECCSGVKTLQPYANSKASRVAICQCLKSMAGMVPGVDLSVASKLPKKCNVNIKLPKLSMDFDCAKA